MVGLKYFVGVLVALALCGVIRFNHPVKEQVKQLEGQISWQYIHANFLLGDTVQELLEWNFNQPLTDEDKVYVRELSDEFLYITGLIFSGNVAHQEWRNRMDDIQGYLNNYVYGLHFQMKMLMIYIRHCKQLFLFLWILIIWLSTLKIFIMRCMIINMKWSKELKVV